MRLRPAGAARFARLARSVAVLATLAAPLALTLLAPAATLASCAMPEPLEVSLGRAPVIFVGTVTETTERNRWAAVAVEEIWKGPAIAASVVVRGGPAGDTASSIDRHFEPGVRYLFVPGGDATTGFTDNSCSPTSEYQAGFDRFRPDPVTAPIPFEQPTGSVLDSGLVTIVGLVAVVSVVLLGIGLLARGRQTA